MVCNLNPDCRFYNESVENQGHIKYEVIPNTYTNKITKSHEEQNNLLIILTLNRDQERFFYLTCLKLLQYTWRAHDLTSS